MGPWLIGRAAGPYGSPNFFNRRPHARPVLVDGVSERITAFRTLSSIGARSDPNCSGTIVRVRCQSGH
jgi:hypothetical protein